MRTRIAVFVVALPIAGCGAGALDFKERIGDTMYEITSTSGSDSVWLFPRRECGQKCPSVHRNIVWYSWNKNAIAVRRQVVNDYPCVEGYVASERLNLYEQYVIDLRTNELVGPMDVAGYKAFLVTQGERMSGIDELPPQDRVDGGGEVLQPKTRCTKPVST